ncbi:protein ALP1-like [Hevea brasiliensis]|uniref:protein ALP1-like n=1 Tax=Hevea brasiliensis TaxID=3981 RepID=UPI0025DA84A8|nr:protein ALP1-like [Hevea brasiliensis]
MYLSIQNCVGALDGTHIRVKVPRELAPRFRGRKEWPTQNVLAACSFDMKFTYVLPGWEGTASDSRILKNALDREDKLLIPQGKFYLVDAGLPLRSGLIAPYRGVRYHLNEYSRRGPQNAKELFNHRHASLRNVIERAFGVLKKRFPIIASGTEPHYSFETMIEIVLACCIIHNFLMGVDPDENLIAEVDRELMHAEADHHVGTSGLATDADYRIGVMLREQIASQMWNDYYNNL